MRGQRDNADTIGCVMLLKCKTETEVERAEIFELARVRIDTVIEANRPHRQLVTQTATDCVAHIAQPNILGSRQQIASVSKHSTLQFAVNWECVFNIEHGKEFSPDWMPVIIMRAEIALTEPARGCGSAVEQTFINRNFGRFAGTTGCKRMNNAGTRPKRDRRLTKPILKTTVDWLIVDHAGREWLWTKRIIVTDAHRASDKFDVATDAARRHVDGVADKKASWINVRVLTKIERVRKSKGIHLIVALSQEEARADLRLSDLHVTNREDQGRLVIFCNFAAQLQSPAQLKLCVAIVIKSEGVHFRIENKVCVKEERILI